MVGVIGDDRVRSRRTRWFPLGCFTRADSSPRAGGNPSAVRDGVRHFVGRPSRRPGNHPQMVRTGNFPAESCPASAGEGSVGRPHRVWRQGWHGRLIGLGRIHAMLVTRQSGRGRVRIGGLLEFGRGKRRHGRSDMRLGRVEQRRTRRHRRLQQPGWISRQWRAGGRRRRQGRADSCRFIDGRRWQGRADSCRFIDGRRRHRW